MMCIPCRNAGYGLTILRATADPRDFDMIRNRVADLHGRCLSRSCPCQHKIPEIDHGPWHKIVKVPSVPMIDSTGDVIGSVSVDERGDEAVKIKVSNPGYVREISEEALEDAEQAAAPIRQYLQDRFANHIAAITAGLLVPPVDVDTRKDHGSDA